MPDDVGHELEPVPEPLQTLLAGEGVGLVRGMQAHVQHAHGLVLEPDGAVVAAQHLLAEQIGRAAARDGGVEGADGRGEVSGGEVRGGRRARHLAHRPLVEEVERRRGGERGRGLRQRRQVAGGVRVGGAGGGGGLAGGLHQTRH